MGPAPGVVKLGKGHHCTCSLAQARPLLSLLDAPIRDAIAAAIHDASDTTPSRPRGLSGRFGMQVALRFPLAPFAQGVADGPAALPALLAAAGLDWHTDAAKYNDKKTFDVVVGVFLSDVTSPSDGALFVRPGSQCTERHARGAGMLTAGALHSQGACTGTAFTTGHGGRATLEVSPGSPPPEPGVNSLALPILCSAGSVIVFDKDLLHAGGPNLSPSIRYALYARMRFET